jgi:DnaJ-class molecular chaperone
MKTFYQLLGCAESATVEELKLAWKSRMKQVHPDVNPNMDPRVATEINRVYGILSDPIKRQQYDSWLAQQRNPRPIFVLTGMWSGTGTTTVYNNTTVVVNWR